MKHAAAVHAIIRQAQSYALGYEQGVRRARQVMGAKDYQGREDLALYLACETKLPVPQIIQALALAPRADTKEA